MTAETAERAALRVTAAAKLNLYLHVTGRRDDGYHLLDSLVCFAGVQDCLSFYPADTLDLTIEGPFGEGLSSGADNLVLQAANRLRETAGIKSGARIVLQKNLPVSSGIGGGSADAAAALSGLSRLWGVNGDAIDLAGLGLALGADVPVCLFGRAAFMTGIGERIVLAPQLPPAWLVLVNPGVAVSTPAVFEARHALKGDTYSPPASFDATPATVAELAEILAARGNDLTEAAIGLQPVVGDVLDVLERTETVFLARMSGSGATCFGLFESESEAEKAAQIISRDHPQWWVQAVPLLADTA